MGGNHHPRKNQDQRKTRERPDQDQNKFFVSGPKFSRTRSNMTMLKFSMLSVAVILGTLIQATRARVCNNEKCDVSIDDSSQKKLKEAGWKIICFRVAGNKWYCPTCSIWLIKPECASRHLAGRCLKIATNMTVSMLNDRGWLQGNKTNLLYCRHHNGVLAHQVDSKRFGPVLPCGWIAKVDDEGDFWQNPSTNK